MSLPQILLIEPFYGGSHKVLIDLLNTELGKNCSKDKVCLVTMSAKKWHWRARTSSLYLSKIIPREHVFRVIFTSSVLNLAELIALRQDLAACKKIVYFHENQIVYPVRKKKDRDFQYGYNEVLTCLVSDLVLFNSYYNYNSFLNNLKTFFRLQPDYRPKNLKEMIEIKSEVLYFPVPASVINIGKSYNETLHIVWPHRWEHDKGIDEFINVLLKLTKEGPYNFKLSMLGEQSDIGEKYESVKQQLANHIVHWGYLEDLAEYKSVLSKAHIAVSTALHEFFGVSMMECAMYQCYPLCPNRLVYPELYPKQCLYDTYEQLYDSIVYFSAHMDVLEQKTKGLTQDWSQYTSATLLPKYLSFINPT